MTSVFVLQHSYELNDCEETKLIGVYSTRTSAELAIERLRLQRGFCDRPDDFTIDEYELDRDHWTEGFVSLQWILIPHDHLAGVTAAQAELLPGGLYRISPSTDGSSAWRFQPGEIVRCRPASDDDPTPLAYESVSLDS